MKNQEQKIGGNRISNFTHPTTQKGITLIALVITIIVMLILVGVTLSFVLNDNGIISKTQEAKTKQEEATDEETIRIAALGYLGEGGIDLQALKNASPIGGYDIGYNTGDNYATATKGGTALCIYKNGEITKGWVNNENGSYTKEDTTVVVGITTYTNAEVLEKLGITNYTGTYSGTWTVIGVEGDKIKLASTENVANIFVLGNEASIGNSADPDLEECISTYKNAVTTLNTGASTKTGIKSARSITLEDIYGIIGESSVSKGPDYGKVYKYYFENGCVYSQYQTGMDESGNPTWSLPGYNTNFNRQTFVKDGITITIDQDNPTAAVELTDDNIDCTWTEAQKKALGVFARDMWLASTCIQCDSDFVFFRVHYMDFWSLRYRDMFFSMSPANGSAQGLCAVVYI